MADVATEKFCVTATFPCPCDAEAHGDVRGQLERGAEPIDPDFYARWLKSKGSLDEAEMCIRAHAAWREAFVTRGRILEVFLDPLPMTEKHCDYDRLPSLRQVTWCAIETNEAVSAGCSMAV